MSENKFKPGDIVQLNSGGPKMTIIEKNEYPRNMNIYECQWFSGAKLNNGDFPKENLIFVIEEKK